MPDTAQPQEPFDSSAGHLSMRIDGRPEVQFQFARQPGRMGVAFLATFALQAGLLLLVFFVGRIGLQKAGILPEHPIDVVFLPQEGPGGGGGGGGNKMKEPPKKAEIPKEKVPTVQPLPAQPKPDPTPTLQFDIPVTTLAQVEIPGAMQAPAGLPTLSQGSGSGGGGGTGRGTGIGPGTGSGLGPGSGGGTGGGPKRPGSGVTSPQPIVEAKPQYTGEAMRARIEGFVWVECTVTKAGRCQDIHVTRSLDTKYGLDQEAINAARNWTFKPGTFQGQPVDVIVSIEIEFRLR
jgi:TonB family protein